MSLWKLNLFASLETDSYLLCVWCMLCTFVSCSSVPVFAEVQKPSVCLSPNRLHICDAFKGAPVVQTIVLMNQTFFETPFKFCQVISLFISVLPLTCT